MSIREELGVTVSVSVNLTSDEMQGGIAQASYDFGVNLMPTKEEVDKAIVEMIASAEEQIGKTGLRITNDRDFGVSIPNLRKWELAA